MRDPHPPRYSRSVQALAALAVLLVVLAAAAAPAVILRQFASGFTLPVEVAYPPGDTNRLFVVEQGGRIRIIEGGKVLPGAFLDVSGIIAAGGERGLLGLAFHPDYARNGAFYVYYTRAHTGAVALARYLRDPKDANRADPASGVVLFEVPHIDFANHNGGRIVFGPDGYLYVGLGDGGGGRDRLRNGQNRGVFLGKILRIAVDGGKGYRIPPANPYAKESCAARLCPEIFLYGLRNPWKFSFDRATGDLYIADVGEDTWEEVDFIPAGSPGGLNLGWGIFEGDACFNDEYYGKPGACAALKKRNIRPVVIYDHKSHGGYSIIGGYVYRGRASPSLTGDYIYGDFVSKRIWAAKRDAAGAWNAELLLEPSPLLASISSFAEDYAGEVYVVDHTRGTLWRIEAR